MFALLCDGAQPSQLAPGNETADNAVIAGLYSEAGLVLPEEGRNLSILPEPARRLFEFSVNAFDSFVHAWMSELPVEGEALAFGRRVLAAALNAPPSVARYAADKAAADRGRADVLAVLRAADKVRHEIDRMRGFLRFSPNEEGVYLAHCEPDHYILPALEEHFTLRFGDTPWMIIDEKRSISIRRPRPSSERPVSIPADAEIFQRKDDSAGGLPAEGGDLWESLWKQYHQTINNESRNNPALQRRFMPQRYRKYLTEL